MNMGEGKLQQYSITIYALLDRVNDMKMLFSTNRNANTYYEHLIDSDRFRLEPHHNLRPNIKPDNTARYNSTDIDMKQSFILVECIYSMYPLPYLIFCIYKGYSIPGTTCPRDFENEICQQLHRCLQYVQLFESAFSSLNFAHISEDDMHRRNK